MATATKETTFGNVTGRQLFDKVRVTVFNELKVNLGGYATSGQDTEFTYLLTTDDKLTKAKVAEVKAFIAGVVACYKSF